MNPLGRFFQTEYQRLVRFVRRRIDDAADRDAEDIVQDVMLKIFDSADVSLPFENLAAYVYRSLRNRVIDLLRTRKTTESLSDVLQDTRYDTARDLERRHIRDLVCQAIGRLISTPAGYQLHTQHAGLRWFRGRYYRSPLHLLDALRLQQVRAVR